jgi:hypothetical protein
VSLSTNGLICWSYLASLAFKRLSAQTTTIPIVAPAAGLAAGMARLGGNLTGIDILAHTLDVKRIEFLHEAVADARRIVPAAAREPEELVKGLEILVFAHIDAAKMLDSPMIFARRTKIIERLNTAHLPAIYAWPETAKPGGLLAYGASVKDQLQQIGRHSPITFQIALRPPSTASFAP